MDIFVNFYDVNSLIRISHLIRMLNNVEKLTLADRIDNFLKANVAITFQLFVFVVIPLKAIHAAIIDCCVPFVNRSLADRVRVTKEETSCLILMC